MFFAQGLEYKFLQLIILMFCFYWMTGSFDVPCDFNGNKVSTTIYFSEDFEQDHHPIHFQNVSIKKQGGSIPDSIMSCLQELKEISIANNVSFEELVGYAVKSATGNKPNS
jgi:hypothetical protein